VVDNTNSDLIKSYVENQGGQEEKETCNQNGNI
jgi:hypothetical protein